MTSILCGAAPISVLFPSSNKEGFSLSSPFSSSTDASGNPVTDASGGMFGNVSSMFSSSPTDASENPTTDPSGSPTVDASGPDASENPVNTNSSITSYVAFFQSLFFLFIKICIIGYLGASFLCLVGMKRTDLTNYLPSDINRYPYCTPDGTKEFGVEGDPIYSYGFPYNLYCDSNDDEKVSKTC